MARVATKPKTEKVLVYRRGYTYIVRLYGNSLSSVDKLVNIPARKGSHQRNCYTNPVILDREVRRLFVPHPPEWLDPIVEQARQIVAARRKAEKATGWHHELLQDCDRDLAVWFAFRMDSLYILRARFTEHLQSIAKPGH